MSGRIEVVPGAHLVAGVGGAVVVVAHRGEGTVTADTVAAKTMAALLDIVREAVAHDRHRSGRAVARLATSWLMNLSNGEEDEAEFGVITPVEDGVAVFLHGGVTAILAGSDRTEVLRGRDAGFTVDRVVTPGPGLGAGLFVDEAGHGAGSLPERGIFALEAGTAPGSGAVLWSGAVQGADAAAMGGVTGSAGTRAAAPVREPSSIGGSHAQPEPRMGEDRSASDRASGHRAASGHSTGETEPTAQPQPSAQPSTADEAGTTSKPHPIAEPDSAVVSHDSSAPHPDAEHEDVSAPRPMPGHEPSSTEYQGRERKAASTPRPMSGRQRVPTAHPVPEQNAASTPRPSRDDQSVSAPLPFSEHEAASAPLSAEPISEAGSSQSEPPGLEQMPAPPRQMSLRKGDSGDAATEVDLQARASRAGMTPPVAQPVPPQPIPPRPERGGMRPEHRNDRDYAIANDTNLAETVVPSAEVVADALGSSGANTLGHRVIVPGFRCARHHHNDPRVSFCAVCGIRMDQLTCVLTDGVRPPLGVLLLDDGTSFVLDNDCVLGREPEYAEAVARGARPVRLDDSSGGMSRAHAEVRLIDWDVTVVDGGSTNGTHIRQPGRPDWIRAIPGHPVTLLPGAQIQLGGRVLTFDSPHGQL
ncbi:FHA domain-containing protein [Nocardia pneumoniae]|uniref:FHA domain-containing protein n=1 Tax=Nocardia pneumoniae TaxID=228601 RepID=UPI0006855036|nr:FHA domain-containing protein [Nocardia pneumoniae]